MSYTVTILVPIFNNKDSILKLAENIKYILYSEKINYELLLIDDGSTDDTLHTLQRYMSNNYNVCIVQLDKNYGQVPAIITGLKYVNSDCCIVMSADFQEPTELIIKMLRKWENGHDLVIGDRISRTDSFISKILSYILFSILHVFNKKLPSKGFDFALIDKSICLKLKKINPFISFLQLSMVDLANKIDYVQYVRTNNIIGKSNCSYTKKTSYALNSLLYIDYNIYIYMFLLGILLLILGLKVSFFLVCVSLLILLFSVIAIMNYRLKFSKKHPVINKVLKSTQ